MTLAVAVTTDLECFSPSVSGSQPINIRQQMLEPAIKLAQLGSSWGIKITFFLEIVEMQRFLVHKNFAQDALELLRFLKYAFESGHEVQLHAHSEWYSAEYKDGAWHRAWSGPDQLHRFLGNLRESLDYFMNDILDSSIPPAWCFRAGAYNVDPTAPLFDVLSKSGIVADSSRHTPQILERPLNVNGLLELPILGSFPTTNKHLRWDMNFSHWSPGYLFDLREPRIVPIEGFAVMQGHTKLPHSWVALERLFRRLHQDDSITPMGIGELAVHLTGECA